ncbi:unsaturated rhamnogalacturonyl hydrolase YteR [Paenibacillus sp. J31TS4]|uniref:glycoside hydrolase family 88/105 protein n=1 Tax=Paenibacillus sp. J31TS4 TaxID=2807195 RepID=UPI001B096465|nr:glycoside hydrolase family 88 protein [Paenibacillus sp. J31TS4]GIP40609.1 unsaturated rhamnogalacturonyl hydrolase YteR [Paenibacillus sp. J31TS4]
MTTMNPALNRIEAKPLDWARTACDALITTFAPTELPPAGRWHYHQGVFLESMLRVWKMTGEEKYLLYPKAYVDALVDEHGNLLFHRDELDSIMAGMLLFPLERQFGEPHYRIAAEKLRQLFRTLNRTSEGGFWHKDKYPYQMWLDGLYMGGVFALLYAERYREPELIDLVLQQWRLMRTHMTDEATGLLYHAWDEARRMPWADPVTGCSPEFWGRSLGWYGMALGDFLDVLPAGHPAREELGAELGRFAQALLPFQDAATGLWYQVVDKGGRTDNWLETSCTSLFLYTLAKAVKHGVAPDPDGFRQAAEKGFAGLSARMAFDADGRFVMPGICIGTSAGDYENYVTRPVSENDLHGVGAFVLACVEMESLRDGRDVAAG